MSATYQIKTLLDGIVTNVIRRNTTRVTWSREGIQRACIFEIEPWRKIGSKPISIIRIKDEISACPFTLPLKIPIMDPYFDYSTYVKPCPSPPLSIPPYSPRPPSKQPPISRPPISRRQQPYRWSPVVLPLTLIL